MNYYKNFKKLKQPKLISSFKKYGFDAHKCEIIDQFKSDIDYAHGKEMFWIRSYMSNSLKYKEGNGLNLTDGGQGTLGWKASNEHRERLSRLHTENPSRGRLGKKCSDEQKKKLSEFNLLNKPKGRTKWTEEQRIAASIQRKGKPILKNRGRKMSEESKLKMSLAKKGKAPWNKGKKRESLP